MRYPAASRPSWSVSAVLSSATVLVLSLSVAAQDQRRVDVKINDLVRETQLTSPDPSKVTTVWWMPEEFWRVFFATGPTSDAEELEIALNVLRPYVVVAIADGTLGPFGAPTFEDPETLSERVVLVDHGGGRHRPLNEELIASDARMLAAMFEPAAAALLGEMGKSLKIFFFDARANDGSTIVSASEKGGFAVQVGDERFEWLTPLSSVLPPKICPIDRREMSGAWTFCPWHGERLIEKSSGG